MFAAFGSFLVTTGRTGEMRLVTRTEAKTGTDDVQGKATTKRAYRSHTTDCRCGQQLDLSARAHCPRCGRAVHRG
jgi:hypothetical protein